MAFEWQTEEDDGPIDEWFETPPDDDNTDGRRWWLWVGMGLLIAAGAWWGYGRLTTQVDERVAEIKADVQAGYRTLQRAADEQDREIFYTVASGADMNWTDAQAALVAQGVWGDRPFAGWTAVDEPRTAIDLAPNLLEATVTVTRTFRTADDETVSLVRDDIFRPGPGRWLYTYPQGDVWGDSEVRDDGFVELVFLERDADLSTAFFERLHVMVRKYCGRLEPACNGPNEKLSITLSSSPTAVPALFSPRQPKLVDGTLPSEIVLELPTFSLIGRPTDETGRRALIDQYLSYVLAAVHRHWVVNAGRGQPISPFDHALFDRQLVRLSLPAVGRAPAADEILLPDRLTQLGQFWQPAPVDETRIASAHQLLDFLAADFTDFDPFAAQFGKAAASSFEEWLIALTGLGYEPLARRWEAYVYARQGGGEVQVFSPPPPQQAQAICTAMNDEARFTFDFVQEEWDLEQLLTGVDDPDGFEFALYPLPSDDGFVVQGGPSLTMNEGNWYTRLTRGGTEVRTFGDDDRELWPQFTGRSSADGSKLEMRLVQENTAFSTPAVLDLGACSPTRCRLNELPDTPIFSPDGRHLLYISETGALHLMNGNGQNSLWISNRAGLAFWVDAERYGYLRPSGEGGLPEVVIAVLGGAEDETMTFPIRDLFSEISDDGRVFLVRAAVAQPITNDIFFVLSGVEAVPTSYVVRYDLASGETAFVADFPGFATELNFAPGGQAFWLPLLPADNATNPDARPFPVVHDLTSGQTTRLPLRMNRPGATDERRPDWSRVGSWLLFGDENSLYLFNPAQMEAPQRYFHQFESCGFVGWVDED